MQSSLTGKLMGAVCKLGEEDNKPCNLYKEKGILLVICHICCCANVCLIGSPIKNLYAQVSDALQNSSAIWVDQTYTHRAGNRSSEHQSTWNRGHQTFMGSSGKVSSGQIYLGIIEGPAAFLLFPPNVVNGPVPCSGERLGQCMLLQETTAVSPNTL